MTHRLELPNEKASFLLLFGLFTFGLYNTAWLYRLATAIRDGGAKNMPPLWIVWFPWLTIAGYFLGTQTLYRLNAESAPYLVATFFLLFFAALCVQLWWIRRLANELAWATHFAMSKKLLFWTWLFWGVPTAGIGWTMWLHLELTKIQASTKKLR